MERGEAWARVDGGADPRDEAGRASCPPPPARRRSHGRASRPEPARRPSDGAVSLHGMATLSPYRSLPAERRVALLTHALRTSRESRALYVQRLVAKGRGFRAVTLQGWPADRLAREVVRANAESAHDELALLQLLYVELEPAIQITFLDAAGVRHENGVMAEELEPPFADADAVRRAVAAVREQHGEEGERYLRTLDRYSRDGWPGIETLVADAPAAAAD